MTSGPANNSRQSPPSAHGTSTSPKAELSAASLANAVEPDNASTSPQHPSVGTFMSRTAAGSSPNTTSSSIGFSFGSAAPSGQAASFTFGKFSPGDTSTMPFPNPPSNNAPRFSFSNAPAAAAGASPPRFSFNGLASGNSPPSTLTPTGSDSSAREPLQTLVFTPSNQKQGSTPQGASVGTKQTSPMPAATAQRPNSEQEETVTPESLAQNSLVSKKLNTQLRELKDVVVDRSDPTSPLYSTQSFEELQLAPDILKGIYNMGFRSPSRIQQITLPILLNNPPRNIIAQSQSGTGKTAAFSIAMLSRVDPSIREPQVLILAPTLELALQIGSVIERLGQFLPYIQVAYAVRDENLAKRRERQRGQLLPEPIIVGTPGTVDEWCAKLRMIDLRKLRMFIVDEADVMIATQGFRGNCVDLVQKLDPSRCQMLLFSATYSDEVMGFARQIIQNPTVLRLKREKQTLSNIRQFFVRCPNSESKYSVIENIYHYLDIGQAVIFCRMKSTANDLAVRMNQQGHSVRLLTGDLLTEQRVSIIDQFRNGVFRVLVSTNVVARGIDIDDVSLVINYDMPVTVEGEPDYETYLHRIGRCGRFGKTGYTFNPIGSEKDFNVMKEIEAYFSHTIDEIRTEDIALLAPREQ